MELSLTSEKSKITYNISLKVESENLKFHIESQEIPKKIYENEFSISDMIAKSKIFSDENYEDINKIFEELQSSIKKPATKLIEKDNILELEIPLLVYSSIKFELELKNDIKEYISQLFYLYKELKNEKDKEISDLIQKNKENKEKIGTMNNEINKLKKELKTLKEEKEKLEKDYKKEIREKDEKNKREHKTFEKHLKDLNSKMSENEDNLSKLDQKIEENIANVQMQILFLTFNNFQNFKSILQAHYDKLAKESTSVLFGEKYKGSYNAIIELIFQSVKGENGKDITKIIEFSGNPKYKKYKEYTQENWNCFLINNVIYQMIFDEDAELNENEVEKTLERIYFLKPDFKNLFKSELEKALSDIKRYVKDYNLGSVIKGIKKFINPKINSLPEEKKILYLTNS